MIRPLGSPSAASQTNGTGISSAAVAGIIIGSFAFGLFATFIAYLFWRRHRIAQANSQAATQYPKAEGEEGTNLPTAWESQGDEITTIASSPSPMRQKDRQYQVAPNRYDNSSDAYLSGRSLSIQGTAFTSQSPPSYLAATTSNSGTR